MSIFGPSHYDYLEDHLLEIFECVGVNTDHYNKGMIGAHGDKAYGYKFDWNQAGIHFFHGVALYLLTYCHPFSCESRETDNGWIDPGKWVIDNYERFKDCLPPVDSV